MRFARGQREPRKGMRLCVRLCVCVSCQISEACLVASVIHTRTTTRTRAHAHTHTCVLSRCQVYAVINKRNGKVVSEEMREGSDSFQVL